MLSLVIITTIIINRCPYVDHHDHHLLIRSRRSDPSIRGRELPGGKDIDNIYDNNILPGGVLKRDYLLIFFYLVVKTNISAGAVQLKRVFG